MTRPGLRLETDGSATMITERSGISLTVAWVMAGALVSLAVGAVHFATKIQAMDDRMASVELQLERIECKLEPETCRRAGRP